MPPAMFKVGGTKLFLLVVLVFCLLIMFSNVPTVGSDWDSVDFSIDERPEVDGKSVEIQEYYQDIDGSKVYIQETVPTDNKSDVRLLLLHGAAFTSDTWKTLGTLETLTKLGITCVAIDLPGYGRSQSKLLTVEEKLSFMAALLNLKVLNKRPIIVTPSMSGSFAIPFAVNHPEKIGGLVAIAPVQTEYYAQRGADIDIPTIVIYGSKDTGLGLTSVKNLNMKTRKVYEFPGASHPAYLDQPEKFHTITYNFVKYIDRAYKVQSGP